MSKLVQVLHEVCGSMFTGFQIFATRNDSVVVDHAEGFAAPGLPMTTATPCYWSSGTKPAIAVALAQIWERGLFSINDHLEDLIEEITFASPAMGRLTLREALTYALPTSPWQDPLHDSNIPDDDILRRISELAPSSDQDPRTSSGYASWPWILAALVIERMSGLSLPEYLRQNVFSPLRMTRSSLGMPAGAHASSGHAGEPSRLRRRSKVTALMTGAGWGPMSDLCRLYRCLLNGGRLDGRRILGEPAVTALTSRLRAGFLEFHGKFVDYGIGFEIEGNWYPVKTSVSFSPATSARTFGHKGWSSLSAFADPEANLTCAIFSNADGGPGSRATEYGNLLRRAIHDWYVEVNIPLPVPRA